MIFFKYVNYILSHFEFEFKWGFFAPVSFPLLLCIIFLWFLSEFAIYCEIMSNFLFYLHKFKSSTRAQVFTKEFKQTFLSVRCDSLHCCLCSYTIYFLNYTTAQRVIHTFGSFWHWKHGTSCNIIIYYYYQSSAALLNGWMCTCYKPDRSPKQLLE